MNPFIVALILFIILIALANIEVSLFSLTLALIIYFLYRLILYILKEQYFNSEAFLNNRSQLSDAVKEYNELAKYVSSFDINNLQSKNLERYDYKDLAIYENTSLYNMNRDRNQKIFASNFYQTSLSVVRRASEEPLKYLCKYFDLKPNNENLELVEELGEVISKYTNAKQNLDDRFLKIQSSFNPPNFIIKHYYKEFLEKIAIKIPRIRFQYPTYIFEYVSAGGNSSQRTTIILDDITIDYLIRYIDRCIKDRKNASRQRALMTKKLRDFIKERDNYTCQNCFASTAEQSLLLLEVDHIIPVSKGGLSTEENLQTLCWKCNRSKSDKIIS